MPPETVTKKFFRVCECKNEFSVSATYYRHKKKCVASQTAENKSHNYVCKEEKCNFTTKFSDDFQQHLQDCHQIDCSTEFKIFSNYSEFEIWKDDYERKTNSYYIHRSEKKSTSGDTVKYFYCNRSGCYKPKSNRKRALKQQGLTKIGSNCPSHIRVHFQNMEENVTVYIQHTHYGHEKEMVYIRIPQSDRNKLAKQVSEGCDFSQILQNLVTENPKDIQRKHLCTRRDLLNIARSYGIKKVKKPPELKDDTMNETEDYLNDFCPFMSDIDDPTCKVLDSTNVLKSLTVENSEVESIKQNLLQKTLNLFEKIQNMNGKNELLTIREHLDNAFLVAEINTPDEDEMAAFLTKTSASDTADLEMQEELQMSKEETTIKNTEFIDQSFQEELGLCDEILIECNITNILGEHAYCSEFLTE